MNLWTCTVGNSWELPLVRTNEGDIWAESWGIQRKEGKVLLSGEPDLIRKSFFPYGKTEKKNAGSKRTSGDTWMKL